MAILSVPFTSVYLVEHVGGGAILHAGGGYLANTLVPPAVIEAFGVASGVLSKVGGVAAAGSAGVSTPVVVGAAALAVVAVSGYCYFHGVPAPIEAALGKAGLGVATKKGFMVSIPQLAVALIVLGGAGYLSYRFYKNFAALRAARLMGSTPAVLTREEAEVATRTTLGDSAWTSFGAAIWANMEDGAQAASASIQDAVNACASLAAQLVSSASSAAAYAKGTLASASLSIAELAGAAAGSSYSAIRATADGSASWGSGISGRLRRLLRWRT